jgi:hypothetical protein
MFEIDDDGDFFLICDWCGGYVEHGTYSLEILEGLLNSQNDGLMEASHLVLHKGHCTYIYRLVLLYRPNRN